MWYGYKTFQVILHLHMVELIWFHDICSESVFLWLQRKELCSDNIGNLVCKVVKVLSRNG